jgi:hypothetical protein
VSARYAKRLSVKFDVPIRLEYWHNTFDIFSIKQMTMVKKEKSYYVVSALVVRRKDLKRLVFHSVYQENVSARYAKRLSAKYDVPIRLEYWHNTFDK